MSALALYSPAPAPLKRVPAGAKLAALAALSVLLFVVPELPVAGTALAAVAVLAMAGARWTPRQLVAQLRPVWLWLAGLLVFHVLVTDLATGALAVLRLATLVLAAAVVTATSKVAELVAVIEWLCAPLRLLGVRPARIGLAVAMTLRFIPVVAERADRIREAQAARGATRPVFLMLVPLLVQVLQLAHTTAEALDARGADDEGAPAGDLAAGVTGRVLEIWTAPAAAAPMERRPSVEAVAGVGLAGDRYALGGGTWASYPLQEKQVTLIDADEVAAVAAEVGLPLTPGLTRRNVVTAGIALPSVVGRYLTVGDVLLFGTKRCPPCTHLERLTGWKLVKALAARGGVNAAVFGGGTLREGDPVRLVSDEEAARRGALVGADRPVPRVVALPD